jgi:hypothetical protein
VEVKEETNSRHSIEMAALAHSKPSWGRHSLTVSSKTAQMATTGCFEGFQFSVFLVVFVVGSLMAFPGSVLLVHFTPPLAVVRAGMTTGKSAVECNVKYSVSILSQGRDCGELTIPQTAQFFRDLVTYMTEPPRVPIDESCGHLPVPNPSELQCSVSPRACTSAPVRTTPAKIGVFVKFAFESDILEAHLREGYDIVDRFVVIEATRTNADHAEKLLVLEPLLWKPRLAVMSDKIVYLILDDSDPAGPLKMNLLLVEEEDL